MTASNYERPPITEAVIELRYADNLSSRAMERIHSQLKRRYDKSEKVSTVQFSFDPKEDKLDRTPAEFIGYKLTNKDQTDVVQIKPNSMSCSRLAPYCGWGDFEARARHDWDVWRKIVKNINATRIGVRYINRIDIPFVKDGKIDIEDYLTVVPRYPEPNLLRSFAKYTMQVRGDFVEEPFHLTINCNTVKSPLINHFSIVLDLDLSTSVEIPKRNDQLWELINKMRRHKNDAFEMCVTDEARSLFN